jgi:hypothetical protein
MVGMNFKMATLIVAFITLFAVAGCTDQQPDTTAEINDEDYVTSFNTEDLGRSLDAYPPGELTAEEVNDLVYMQEEEKLARDVYLALYEKWGLQVFINIGDAEQTHMDSIAVLIERYGLENPLQDSTGAFTNQNLQSLYEQLVLEGSASREDALRVGALIEEIDIIDLEEAVERTDNEDVIFVYENLMRGSRNHLRAFVRNLERQGGTYEPAYLEEDEYQEIVSSPAEQGGFT